MCPYPNAPQVKPVTGTDRENPPAEDPALAGQGRQTPSGSYSRAIKCPSGHVNHILDKTPPAQVICWSCRRQVRIPEFWDSRA